MPPTQPGQLASILILHEHLVEVFDPVDDSGEPIANVGLDGFDIISVRVSNANDPRPLRVFWSSEIDFFTGPVSPLGAGIAISHGDLLTNKGSIWRNAPFVDPFDPRDALGMPLDQDFGLDAVNAAGVPPLFFDTFPPGVQSSVPFGLIFSFEEEAADGADAFFSNTLLSQRISHGDALAYSPSAPTATLFRTQAALVTALNGQASEHGLDGIDVPEDEAFETGSFDLSMLDPVLFSLSEIETLLGADHGDLLGETTGLPIENPELTGDPKEREFGLDGFDVICFEPVPVPLNLVMILLNGEHPGMSYDLNADGVIDASDLLGFRQER